MAWVRGLIVFFVAALALTASAQAPQKRVALIIANSAYQGERVLENPARDGALVEDSLKRAGFTVRVEANLTQQGMTAALQRFRREVEGAQVALIYFAGHGVRVGQTNWMLPVDFRADEVRQDEDFELFAIAHRSMTQALAGARVKVAVFDACRNNPYEARLQLAARSVGRSSTASSGLASVEIGDVLVLFSAAPGQVATDGQAGQGTPFAQAFARRLVEPGAEIGLVARRVRADVMAATGGGRAAQAPFIGGSPGPEEVVLVAAARPAPQVTAPDTRDAEIRRLREELAKRDAAPKQVATRPDVPQGSQSPSAVNVGGAGDSSLTTGEDRIASSVGAPIPARTAGLTSGDVFRECPSCPLMVVVGGGWTVVGASSNERGREPDERPLLTVSVERFAVAKFETTIAEWGACVADRACVPVATREQALSPTQQLPITNVSWNDAFAYAAWISKLTGRQYRLLTEVEWTYLARGRSDQNTFGIGPNVAALCGRANVGAISSTPCSAQPSRLLPVGSFPAELFGTHDILGNVQEWVADCYLDNLDHLRGGKRIAPERSACHRGTRGASFRTSGEAARVANRGFDRADGISQVRGFRLAANIE